MNPIDFRRSTPQTYRDGWTMKYETVTFCGKCILCGTRTYVNTAGNDPRGMLGDHVAAELGPQEHGYTGPVAVLPACFMCQNDTEEKYNALLRIARKRWWNQARAAEGEG